MTVKTGGGFGQSLSAGEAQAALERTRQPALTEAACPGRGERRPRALDRRARPHEQQLSPQKGGVRDPSPPPFPRRNGMSPAKTERQRKFFGS